MAILLDSFSYRVKRLSGGVYLDRWDGNTFPEFILPERLYFIKNIINSLLLHDKIYIRITSLEEFIEVFGIEATSLLISKDILKILDGWSSPKIMAFEDQNFSFWNTQIPSDSARLNIISRLSNRYRISQYSYLYHVLYHELLEEDASGYLDSIALDNTLEDINIPVLKAHLNLKTEDLFNICDDDAFTIMRLFILERTLVWSREFRMNEIGMEGNAKYWLTLKSGRELDQSLMGNIDQVLKSKALPDLSILYYKGAITLQDILEVRENVHGVKFREWIAGNDYDWRELQNILIAKKGEQLITKWLRFGAVTGLGLWNPYVGIAAGIIDQVVGALTKWTPELYFDGVLSNKFGSKRLRSLNTLDDHDIK